MAKNQVDNNQLPFPVEPVQAPVIATGAQLNAYSSMDTDSAEGKKALFNALTNADNDVADFINETLEITDIIATPVELEDEDDDGNGLGTFTKAVRIVLVDAKGVSYNTVSKGMHRAVENLIMAFGEPNEWDAPMKLKIKQVKVKRGSMLTFELV